jgi:hypothetical protein
MRVLAIFVACAALSALLLLPGLIVGPSLDAAVFAHAADRMRDGATLYTDIWDHKPPGIYLILAAAQAALPFIAPWAVSWILSVTATAGTGAAIAVACRRLGVSEVACLVAAALGVAAMAQFLLALGGGLTEPVAVLPVAVALAMSVGDTRSAWRSFLIGLLLAGGALVSVQVAVAALPVAWIVLARPHRRALMAASLVGGAAALVLAAGAWLSVSGALPDAVDAVVRYGAAYRSVGVVIGATLAGPVVAWTLLALLYFVVPATLGAVAGLRGDFLPRIATVASLAWIGLAVVSYAVQGRFLAHYTIPLAVPLAVLAGMGMDVMRMRLVPGRGRPLAAAFAVTALISVGAAIAGGAMELQPIAADHARSTAVARFVDKATSDGDRIWVWGNEPQVYLDANRGQATPYSYLYPLVTPGYTDETLIEDAASQLGSEAPRLIIDAGSAAPGQPGFQSLLIPRPLASDGRDVDILDPLRAAIGRDYEELETIEGWVLYGRRDSAP